VPLEMEPGDLTLAFKWFDHLKPMTTQTTKCNPHVYNW